MTDEQRAAKRRKFANNIIALRVGSSQEELAVHKETLKKHSPFFRTMVEKNWKEKSTRVIDLPEDDIDVVATYVHWLYDGTVGKDDFDPSEKGAYCMLAKHYIFGEKIQDDGFCDAVFLVVCHCLGKKVDEGYWVPTWNAVQLFYQGTPEGAPIRGFLVELYAQNLTSEWLRSWAKYPSEFTMAVTERLLELRSERPGELYIEGTAKWLKKNEKGT